jgi:hypothetical protein
LEKLALAGFPHNCVQVQYSTPRLPTFSDGEAIRGFARDNAVLGRSMRVPLWEHCTVLYSTDLTLCHTANRGRILSGRIRTVCRTVQYFNASPPHLLLALQEINQPSRHASIKR